MKIINAWKRWYGKSRRLSMTAWAKFRKRNPSGRSTGPTKRSRIAIVRGEKGRRVSLHHRDLDEVEDQ